MMNSAKPNFDDIMNQQEAADYISSRGIRMTGPMLSEKTNTGLGPDCTRKGNQKLFLRDDVDAWIEKEKKRRSQ